MLVHVEIAIGFDLQIETAVFGEQLEHMIEEADSGGDVVLAAAFDLQLAGDLRLLGVSLNGGGSHLSTPSSWLISSSTALAPSACSSETSSSRRSLDGDA